MMQQGWKQLGLSPEIASQCSSFGLHRPTTIQTNTIPAILKGQNVIGAAKTGSGKTAAFALPILQKLSREPYGIFALVLSPTRYVTSILDPIYAACLHQLC